MAFQNFQTEKHPGFETSLPSYSTAAPHATTAQQEVVYPPFNLVAPLPEPHRRTSRLAYGFGMAGLLVAEMVLVNCIVPQQSLVVATNPFTSLDVYAIGIYGKDPMWDNYTISPSEAGLKIIASLHIVAAVFTATTVLTALLAKSKPSCIGERSNKFWTLLIFVPFVHAIVLAFAAWISDWCVLQQAVNAGQDPDMDIAFSGGDISHIIATATFALVVAGICLAYDLRHEAHLLAEKNSVLPMPFKIAQEQEASEQHDRNVPAVQRDPFVDPNAQHNGLTHRASTVVA